MRGGSFHELGLHERGLADRSMAIKLKPNWAEAWFARGTAYFLLGDYVEALADLDQALRIKPEFVEASAVRERAQQAIAAVAPADMRDFPQPVVAAEPSHPASSTTVTTPSLPVPPQPAADAIPVPAVVPANRVLSGPGIAEAEWHHQRGRELLDQHKYKDALAELSEAIRLNPKHALAFNARGFVYYLMREYSHALADFDTAIQLCPSYRNAYQNRALARKASGDFKGAQEDESRVQSGK